MVVFGIVSRLVKVVGIGVAFCLGLAISTVNSSEPEKNFRLFEHRNIIGGHLGQSKPGRVSFEKCEQICRRVEACRAYSYDREKKICYVKRSAEKFEEKTTFSSGILTSLTPPPAPPCSAEVYGAVKALDSEVAYNSFLSKCKKGKRWASAKKRLAEIVEEQDWQNAIMRGSCQAYDDYVRKYLNSGNARLGQAKIAKQEACDNEARQQRQQARQRRELEAWQTALNKNSCSGFGRFLRRYPSPSGTFFRQAKDKKTAVCTAERAERQRQSNEEPEQRQQTSAPRCGWYVISGCYRDWNKIKKRANRIGARVIRTDDYPNFNPGWFCAVFGPYSKATAQRKKYRYHPSYIKNAC